MEHDKEERRRIDTTIQTPIFEQKQTPKSRWLIGPLATKSQTLVPATFSANSEPWYRRSSSLCISTENTIKTKKVYTEASSKNNHNNNSKFHCTLSTQAVRHANGDIKLIAFIDCGKTNLSSFTVHYL